MPTKTITITVPASSLTDRVLDVLSHHHAGLATWFVHIASNALALSDERYIETLRRVRVVEQSRLGATVGALRRLECAGFVERERAVSAWWRVVAPPARRELHDGQDRVEWSATIEVRS